MGVGATPNRFTYPHFQKLTPESTLEEIWYGSRGIYLIGAPICVFKNLVGLYQSHLALNQSQVALKSYSKLDGPLGNFATCRKIWLTRIKARIPSTQGLLTRSSTMGATSPGLGREEQGAYQGSGHSA
jgi:hypothetical protein